MSDNTFEIDADPADFDLDDWISGASLPARAAKVYRNAGLRATYDELEQQFNRLQLQAAAEQEQGTDASVAEGTVTAKLYEVALRMREVINDLESSALVVKVRACSADELDELSKSKIKDPIDRAYWMLEHGGLYPHLDAAGWKKLRNAIGEKQFDVIVNAANDANGFTRDQVVPDFSHAASALLTTPLS